MEERQQKIATARQALAEMRTALSKVAAETPRRPDWEDAAGLATWGGIKGTIAGGGIGLVAGAIEAAMDKKRKEETVQAALLRRLGVVAKRTGLGVGIGAPLGAATEILSPVRGLPAKWMYGKNI